MSNQPSGIYISPNLAKVVVSFREHVLHNTSMEMTLPLIPKLLLLLVVGLAIAYVSACVSILLWQNRLIFHPSRVVETTPAAFKLDYQEVWLQVPALRNLHSLAFLWEKAASSSFFRKNERSVSSKAEHIHCWWIPAADKEAGVMLYFHGNGINIGANVVHAHRLHQLGFSVLLVDYRGYGRAEGRFPTESRVYEDAETAWNYLIQERQVPADQIFIYGHSLGGAIAINLAVQHPEAAGLIVEGSFTSIQKMAEYRGYYWMFPAGLLINQRFDSLAKLPALQIPVLFLHGTADHIVPYQMSQMLFASAREPKQLILFPEARHNNLADVAGSEYFQAIQNFIEQVRMRQNKPTHKWEFRVL